MRTKQIIKKGFKTAKYKFKEKDCEKSNAMARIFSIVLGLMVIMANVSNFSSKALAIEGIDDYFVHGTWQGTYSGHSNSKEVKREITLEITDCDALGGFLGIATIDYGNGGMYYFEGEINFRTGATKITGKEWLKNPQNYVLISFDGKIDSNLVMKGIVNGSSNRNFTFTKISDECELHEANIYFIPSEYEGEYDGSHDGATAKRNMKMTIDTISSNGDISGRIDIAPSSKSDAKYSASGRYAFSGNLNINTGRINLKGNEWLLYPMSLDNFGFIEFDGIYIFGKNLIEGSTPYGKWTMNVADSSKFATVSQNVNAEKEEILNEESEKTFKVANKIYMITDEYKSEIMLMGTTANPKSLTVSKTVKHGGKNYTIVGISKNAFESNAELKTLIIKSDKLTKSGVKNSLNGSNVTVVKLSGSSVKKRLKEYKKYFAKSNCGKKVTIKK